MIYVTTPFLRGKLDAVDGHKPVCPYDEGSPAASEYAEGYARGLQVSVSPEDHEKRDTKTSHQGSSVHQSVAPPEG